MQQTGLSVRQIIVAKPPRRGVYVFNGMPTMTAPLWNKRVKPKG